MPKSLCGTSGPLFVCRYTSESSVSLNRSPGQPSSYRSDEELMAVLDGLRGGGVDGWAPSAHVLFDWSTPILSIITGFCIFLISVFHQGLWWSLFQTPSSSQVSNSGYNGWGESYSSECELSKQQHRQESTLTSYMQHILSQDGHWHSSRVRFQKNVHILNFTPKHIH